MALFLISASFTRLALTSAWLTKDMVLITKHMVLITKHQLFEKQRRNKAIKT